MSDTINIVINVKNYASKGFDKAAESVKGFEEAVDSSRSKFDDFLNASGIGTFVDAVTGGFDWIHSKLEETANQYGEATKEVTFFGTESAKTAQSILDSYELAEQVFVIDKFVSLIEHTNKFQSATQKAFLAFAKGTVSARVAILSFESIVRDAFDSIGSEFVKVNDTIKQTYSRLETAAGFEFQLARISAVARPTIETFEQIKHKAVEMGKETAYTFTQAAAGMDTLVRAGVSTEGVITSIDDVLNLAFGNVLQLGESAGYVTSTLALFELGIEQAGRVVDVLSKGAAQANTTVPEMALAIQYAGKTAKAAGMTLEKTVAILDALAQGGLRSEKAGTALRSILSKLINPASKARQILAQLGDTSGDFDTAMKTIAQATQSTDEVIQALGRDAILAFDVAAVPALHSFVDLAVQSMSDGQDAVEGFHKELMNASGFAQQSSDIMMDTAQGAFLRLQSAWEGMVHAFEAPILYELTVSMNYFAVAVGLVGSAITGFTELLPGTTSLLAYLVVPVFMAISALKVLSAILFVFVRIGLSALIFKLKDAALGFVAYANGASGASVNTAIWNSILKVTNFLLGRFVMFMKLAVVSLVTTVLPIILISEAFKFFYENAELAATGLKILTGVMVAWGVANRAALATNIASLLTYIATQFKSTLAAKAAAAAQQQASTATAASTAATKAQTVATQANAVASQAAGVATKLQSNALSLFGQASQTAKDLQIQETAAKIKDTVATQANAIANKVGVTTLEQVNTARRNSIDAMNQLADKLSVSNAETIKETISQKASAVATDAVNVAKQTQATISNNVSQVINKEALLKQAAAMREQALTIATEANTVATQLNQQVTEKANTTEAQSVEVKKAASVANAADAVATRARNAAVALSAENLAKLNDEELRNTVSKKASSVENAANTLATRVNNAEKAMSAAANATSSAAVDANTAAVTRNAAAQTAATQATVRGSIATLASAAATRAYAASVTFANAAMNVGKSALSGLAGLLSPTNILIAAGVGLWYAWDEATKATSENMEEFAKQLQKVKQEAAFQEEMGRSAQNVADMSRNDLIALRQSLVDQSQALNDAQGALVTASNGYKLLGMEWLQLGGLTADEFNQKFSETEQEAQKVREQFFLVNDQLKQMGDVDVSKLSTTLRDSEEDLKQFYETLQTSFDAQNFDEQIRQVTEGLANTLDALDLSLPVDQQKAIAATREAANAIIVIEQARYNKSIELAERNYLVQATAIKRNQENAQGERMTYEQQAQAMKQAAQDLATARVEAAQKAYDATQKQLDKAREDYQKYADEVKTLEKSISDERNRQSDSLREMNRARLADENQFATERTQIEQTQAQLRTALQSGDSERAQQLYDRKAQLAEMLAQREQTLIEQTAQADRRQELAEINAQFEQAMADQNFKRAEELARKRETLVNQVGEKQIALENNIAQQRDALQRKSIELAKQAADASANGDTETANAAEQQRVEIQQRLNELSKAETDLQANKFNTLEQTKQVHDQINQAMLAQKESANANAEEQKQLVSSLSESMSTLGEQLQVLTQEQVNLKINVNTEDLDAEFNTIREKYKGTEVNANIKPDTTEIDKVLTEIKKPTESTHTINVRKAEMHSLGGVVGSVMDFGKKALHFATGGKLPGFDPTGRDDVPVWATAGEYIVNAVSTNEFGSILHLINNFPEKAKELLSGIGIQGFSTGGLVQGLNQTIQHFSTGGLVMPQINMPQIQMPNVSIPNANQSNQASGGFTATLNLAMPSGKTVSMPTTRAATDMLLDELRMQGYSS